MENSMDQSQYTASVDQERLINRIVHKLSNRMVSKGKETELDNTAGTLTGRSGQMSREWEAVTRKYAGILNDGLLPAGILLILFYVNELLVMTAHYLGGMVGKLIVGLFLMSLSAIVLERSIQSRSPIKRQIWYGMIAGLYLFAVVEIIAQIGDLSLNGEAVILLLILAVLLVSILWKTVFPIGIKVFTLVFLLNWLGKYTLGAISGIIRYYKAFDWLLAAIEFGALAALLFFVLWLFKRPESPIRRMQISVGVWFSAWLVITMLTGWLY